MDRHLVRLPDGRDLDVVAGGPRSDTALLVIMGRPSGAIPYARAVAIAADRGLAYLGFARPGYARSTRHAERSVATVARDIGFVAETLGFSRLYVVGWSGGGPAALASAALLPGHVLAAATLASVAPHREDGVDWRAWLGTDLYERVASGDGFAADCEQEARTSERAADDVRRSALDWAPPVDIEVLAGDEAVQLAAQMVDAYANGFWGIHDDDRSHVRDWGFDPGAMRTPVVIWHGMDDTLVPVAHGRWLAEHVGGARAHILDGEGHISISVRHFERAVDELMEIAAPGA